MKHQENKQDKRRWRWTEGTVKTDEEHVQICYGGMPDSDWERLPKIVLLSPPQEKIFTVQFLLIPTGKKENDMIREVRRELDFFLLEKKEENPWAYARYHCGTAANFYSKVHWSFFPKGWKDSQQNNEKYTKKGEDKLSVHIVPAEKGDLKAILNLIKDFERYDVEFAKRYYDVYFKKDKITEKDKVFVAKLDGKTIGVSGFCRDYFSSDYSYWLGWFVVDKEYRGKNKFAVAKRLIERVEAELRKRKIRKLFVNTEDKNARAKSFYAKNQFRTEAVLRDYYYKGEDQLILSKVLIAR